MRSPHSPRPATLLCLACLAFLSPSLPTLSAATVRDIQTRAEQFERSAEWDKACALYGEILHGHSNTPAIRSRYLHCLRRYFQGRRYDDPSYQKEMLSLDYRDAIDLYQSLLEYLTDHALVTGTATPEEFFRKGLEEFRHALAHPAFQRQYLGGASPEAVRLFRTYLRDRWDLEPVYSIEEATNGVRDVTIEAVRRLKLPPTVVILEFVWGSCYAIDDYTMYLTPAEFRGLYESLKGESAGTGLKLTLLGEKLVVSEIAPDSPARELDIPLVEGDQVLSIDQRPTAGLSALLAMELLQGEAGSQVELVVSSPMLGTRMVLVRRRPVFLPSVPPPELKTESIGYIKIASFQETTPQELDSALSMLAKVPVKGLILDLRGNSGGLLGSAIDVTRQFLPSGLIVSVQTPRGKRDNKFYARNATASHLPLVVLVDGETASAAELMAGALKENGRARLVGKTTYGKSCIQDLRRVRRDGSAFPGGLRITVAQFLSPSGESYTGKGVEPHVTVDRELNPGSLDPTDQQLSAAVQEMQYLLQGYMMR